MHLFSLLHFFLLELMFPLFYFINTNTVFLLDTFMHILTYQGDFSFQITKNYRGSQTNALLSSHFYFFLVAFSVNRKTLLASVSQQSPVWVPMEQSYTTGLLAKRKSI